MTAKPSVICHSDVFNTSCTHLPFWIPTASSVHSSAVKTQMTEKLQTQNFLC